MNYISNYDDMKFEAEMLKTTAFAVVSPFGLFVLQIFMHGVKSSWEFLIQTIAALGFLGLFFLLTHLAHARMADREKCLKWLHNRKIKWEN